MCRHVVTNDLGHTGHRERLGGNQVKAKNIQLYKMPHTLIECFMYAAKSLKQRETNAHLVAGRAASFSNEWQ